MQKQRVLEKFIIMRLFLLLVFTIGHVGGAPVSKRIKDDRVGSTFPYSLTPPEEYDDGSVIHSIAIISDLDKRSMVSTYLWRYKILKGRVTVKGKGKNLKVSSINWDKPEVYEYNLGQKGRGMEMSELKAFNGRLYTCDDATGMVYEIVEGKPLAFVHLNDGDGRKNKQFKCEWMTVRENNLYIGSTGQDWVKNGKVVNQDKYWVKKISSKGVVKVENWIKKYQTMKKLSKTPSKGYLTHEAANWSKIKKKWFFLPRKQSKTMFDHLPDQKKGTNIMFSSSDSFKDVQMTRIGKVDKDLGFSAFKFIPGSEDEVFLALKTAEIGERVETWIGAFNTDGKVVYSLKKLHDEKFEGIEFI